MSELKNISTADLVHELTQREGVNKIIAEPYKDAQVNINGPAIILVVTD